MRARTIMAVVSLAMSARADSAGPGSPDQLLVGCTEKATRPGERALECPNFSVYASVEQPAFGEEAVLKMMLDRLKRRPEAQIERATVMVGKQPRHGLRYTLLDEKRKPATVAVLAMVPSSDGERTRMVGCEEKLPSLCERAITALAAQLNSGAPPVVTNSGGAPLLAGRAVAVPPGCKLNVDGPKSVLACGKANLSWVAMHSDDPPDVDWIYQPMKSALATRGKLTERERACTVDGVATRCHEIDVARPDGTHLSTTCAMVTLRGQRLWLQCNVSAGLGLLPPPCDALIH